MKLIVKGGNLDVSKLRDFLNVALSEYNIEVNVFESSRTSEKQVIDIGLRLRKAVYYSPFHSQFYDRVKDEYFESSGIYLNNPEYKFGRKAKFAHFYHFALFNDTIVYIMNKLKDMGLIKDWELRSAVLKVKDEHWRRNFPYEYLPQFDPAFRRPLVLVKRFKGIKITTRRDQALELIGRLPGYIESGKLSPKDIPQFMELFTTLTEIKKLYNPYPKTLDDVEPVTRAYILVELGRAKGEEIVSEKGMEFVNEYRKRVEEFLSNVKSVEDPKFKKFLDVLVSEVKDDIRRYNKEVGEVVSETLKDTDSAGFPYGLAKHLVTKPYVPPEVKEYDVRTLVRKERVGERVLH